MSQVTYRYNFSNRLLYKKHFKRWLWFVIICLIILAIIVAIVFYKVDHLDRSSQSSRGVKEVSYIAGPKLFKNSYFEFSSGDNWTFDQHDSSANKLMYLLHQDDEVAGSFEVYINQVPITQNLATSMVLPVQISGNHFSSIGAVSEPCGNTYKANAPKDIEEVSLSSTSMLCVPDTSQYTVILGRVGGDYNLKMTRSNSEMANYIIIYRSSSFTPSAASFLNLLSTFKTL